MSRLSLVKSCLFHVVASTVLLTGLPGGSQGADAAQQLSVIRNNEKTVYVIESPRGEDNQDTAKTCEVLRNLRIDLRGEDGKGPDSDRRGRGEHP